jgi:hypothetical protein
MGMLNRFLDWIERVHLFAWLLDLVKWPKIMSAIFAGAVLGVLSWLEELPLSVIALIVLGAIVLILALIAVAIHLSNHIRQWRRGPLEIITEMREIKNLYGPTGERLFIGIKNNGLTTLYGVTLRAQESWFTRAIIAVAHRSINAPTSQEREPILAEFDHIDPGAIERTESLGINYHNDRNPNDILASVQRFVLEVRAKDAKTVVCVLEYDPATKPLIKKVSSK